MSNAKEYVKTLTISDLFDDENKCKYIIPIYQRNYAWGDDEISSLLQDIKNACEKLLGNFSELRLDNACSDSSRCSKETFLKLNLPR